MLSFFRINDPYRLVVIFLVIIVVRLIQAYFIDAQSYFGLKWLLLGEWLNQDFKMYSEAFDYTGPIAVFVYKFLYSVFGRSEFIHFGFSSIIIIYQAGIFNQLLLRNKAYNENSYLPAFLYVIIILCIPDFMALSPQLMSLTFILLALRNVLRRIDNQATDELFLNSGIFIGIATMIYLPAIVFLVVFLFALILFSSAITRRILLYLFSFLLVFAVCSLYFFWVDNLRTFIDSFLLQSLALKVKSPFEIVEVLIIVSAFLFIFIVSVFKTLGSARLTNFQQKIQQVIWLMLLGGIATFFLSNEKSLHELVFITPTVAYFWTHYFVLLKRRIFQFVMPGLMILGMIVFSIYSYATLVEPIKVSGQSNAAENTMIIGSDLAYYRDARIKTPCFTNSMTRKAFNGLDYYRTAGQLYNIFEKSDPNLIIDDMGLMPQVFFRFPLLKESYQPIGRGRYEKINN